MKNYAYILIVALLLSAGLAAYEKSDTQKSIYVVSMTTDEMSSGLRNGTIAGFISWEPYPAKAVSDGYGRYLVNSKDIWENHPSCVLAISEDMKDEDTIKALAWAHVKGTRFINDPANREKVLKYGQEFSGLDRATVLAAINNTLYIEYPDLNQTKKGIEILDNAGALKNNVTSMGYSDIDEFLSGLFLEKYYNEIKSRLDDDPYWTPLDLRELRAVVTYEWRRLKLQADGGIAQDRARSFGPGGGPTPTPFFTFPVVIDRTFHPWRASAEWSVPFGARIELRGRIRHEVTSFYRVNEIEASLGGRL